jgi:deoxyribodipyrimidine photo-lyase
MYFIYVQVRSQYRDVFYLFTGQISVQRCILSVKQYRSKYKESVEAYIEEAIIRRELADNYCYYNKNYDSIEGM